ncbi:MAG: hypothetical protein ACI9TI_002207, partial [Natronomonas sp.]
MAVGTIWQQKTDAGFRSGAFLASAAVPPSTAFH